MCTRHIKPLCSAKRITVHNSEAHDMSRQIIGRGTWLDLVAHKVIEREDQLTERRL